ncbi:MAG: ABC transporter ATP-binding protein [Alphaproteobacteria bacterium]
MTSSAISQRPLLEIQDLSVSFAVEKQLVEAVRNVSFSLPHGKTLALVGESGSGKSTIAHAVLRLLPYPKAFHPSGKIFFEGQDLLTVPDAVLRKIRGERIGMIFQEPMTALSPLHTLFKQIGESLWVHQRLKGPALEARILELLDLVGFPEGKDRLKAYPHQLSGGQRQRVMIAMALACNPDVLIADEPTTAMDVTLQAEILEQLKAIQHQTNMGLLLITHHLGVVQRMADEVVVLAKGSVVERGLQTSVFQNPNHAYTKRLLASAPSGDPVQMAPEAPGLAYGKNLSVWFSQKKGLWSSRSKHALQNLSFHISKGETLGIVGESGSGKTTLAMALLRMLPFQGQFIFQGQHWETLSRKAVQRLRPNLQMVFQDPFGSLNPRFSVLQIIAEGLEVHRLTRTAGEKEDRVCRALQDVGLDPADRHRYPHEFSGGQRQRIALARALVLNPALVILDEPTSALDLSIQADILALLKKLQTLYQLSYLFISHDLAVIRSISHRVIVMQEGSVVEEGPTHEVFENPQHPYTRSLMKASLAFHLSSQDSPKGHG